jgi:3-oxoacyl-[acyl-carrier-protein] synthase-3
MSIIHSDSAFNLPPAHRRRGEEGISAEGSDLASRMATRSPLCQLMGVQIVATGAYAPPIVVTNEDLAPLGFDSDWIVQRTGIRARRRAPADWATSDVAFQAAKGCLEQAGVAASEVDLIIVATMTPDSQTPSTACRLQQMLGCKGPAMDLNAACAGFLYGLVTGMQFLKSGCCQCVLVVGVDLMSRTVNPEDKKTFPLFGDGGGAVLLRPGESQQGLLAYTLGADGNGGDILQVPAGGTREALTPEGLAAGRQFLHMDGKAVFKWAVRLLGDAIRDVLRHANLTLNDIDHFVVHQANRRIIDAAVQNLGVPESKVIVNLDRYGNTSAGSIPLGLDELHRSGRIRRGDLLLFCGFGAGLAWGAAVLEW